MGNTEKKTRLNPLRMLLTLVMAVIPLVLALLVLFNFRLVVTEGPSMEPTYTSGDLILCKKLSKEPQPGDLVLIQLQNGTMVLKRVAYVAGQDVSQGGHTGYWYTDHWRSDIVKDGYVFVLGDNPDESFDSRDEKFGLVPVSSIWGTPVFQFDIGRGDG